MEILIILSTLRFTMATTKLNRKVIIQLHVLEKKRKNAPYLKENTLEHTVQGTVCLPWCVLN